MLQPLGTWRPFAALLVLLAGLALSGGCAADGGDQDESDINSFFDGPVVRRLISLMKDVDEAEAATADDKSRLAKEMSTFGPALTKAQQTAYVAGYQKLERVVANQRRYVIASRALRDFMGAPEGGGALKSAAPRTAAAAEALFLGHQKLASTPYALPAAGFAAWAIDRRNQTGPLARSLAKYDWPGEVLTPAITHGAGQAVAEAQGDPQGVFAKLTEQLGSLMYANQDHMEVYAGWAALVTTVRTRDMSAFNRLDSRLAKLPVVGALMAVGVLYNVLSVAGDVQGGNVSQETFATAGDAAQQLSRALISISEAGLLGRFGGGAAATFSTFLQRITPGLGILCTTASLRNHIAKTGSDGAIGAYIGALGDVIALAGVLAESFGVTAPLGSIIVGLGFTLSFLGDIVQDWLAESAIIAEERLLLRAARIDEKVASVLVGVNARHLQAWSDVLKFDAVKLQWLATNAPNTLTAGWLSGFRVDGFAALVRDLGYANDGGFAVLQSIPDAVTESGGAGGVYDFVRDIGPWSFSGADLRAQWLRAIDAQAKLAPAEHARAFSNAATYLRAN